MNFLKKRGVARTIAIIVCIVSTIISGSSGLKKACAKTENAFFKTSDGKAPAYYIDQIISAAASLATVGEHYSELDSTASDLRTARKDLVSAYEDKDVQAMNTANTSVQALAKTLKSQLESANLSTEDQSTVTDSCSTISGGQKMIAKSTYNSEVKTFLEKIYNKFPANLLASIFSIEAPVVFEE